MNKDIKLYIKNIVNSLLKEQTLQQGDDVEDDNDVEHLYHVTYFNRLKNISSQGLVTNSSRTIGSMAYDSHAKKGLFLTSGEGVSFWFNRAEEFANDKSDNPFEEGFVPVVLQIDMDDLEPNLLTQDELGTSDALHDAFIYTGNISPNNIGVWDGEQWIYVEDYEYIDTSLSFDVEEIEDEFGEPEIYYNFKYDNENPLLPKVLP